MNGINITKLATLKGTMMPADKSKQQIINMLDHSTRCTATVVFVEKNTGKYRIVVEGQLGESNQPDSSYYFG